MNKTEEDKALGIMFAHMDMFLGTPRDTKKEFIGMAIVIVVSVIAFALLAAGVI
jgi:hypothetical protein